MHMQIMPFCCMFKCLFMSSVYTKLCGFAVINSLVTTKKLFVPQQFDFH